LFVMVFLVDLIYEVGAAVIGYHCNGIF
jgi:hypothetical protein